MLLLESETAVGSEWVQHEVSFALAHGIPLLALRLPETGDHRFPAVDDAFRMELKFDWFKPMDSKATLDERVLDDEHLERILDLVEERHAQHLRRRREQLLLSLRVWLERANIRPESTTNEWAVGATGIGGESDRVFLVTPRVPSPRDLHSLDDLRRERMESSGRDVAGHLVSATAVQDEEEDQLMNWIAQGRPLFTHSIASIPDFLDLR